MLMPVETLNKYIKWKVKYDEEIARLKEEELKKMESESRTNLKNNTFR